MDIKITNEQETPYLNRKLIQAEVSFKGATPNREEIKKAISAETGSKQELMVIRSIATSFGKEKAKVKSYIYDSPETMNKVETKQMLKRNTKKEEKKEGEE